MQQLSVGAGLVPALALERKISFADPNKIKPIIYVHHNAKRATARVAPTSSKIAVPLTFDIPNI